MISLGTGLYSTRVAARVARVKYQHFQAWVRANLLQPHEFEIGRQRERLYTYRDLLLIRLIVRLRECGAKTTAIKTALHTISIVSEEKRDAWMKATILVSSGVIVVFFPDKPEWSPMAASKGPQKMAVVFFPELIEQLKEELVPPGRFPHIEVNPEIVGGAPVIRGTRISTRAVVSVIESGEDPVLAYPSLTREQVENAKAYEEFLSAA